jgi:hypothetical protein
MCGACHDAMSAGATRRRRTESPQTHALCALRVEEALANADFPTELQPNLPIQVQWHRLHQHELSLRELSAAAAAGARIPVANRRTMSHVSRSPAASSAKLLTRAPMRATASIPRWG